MDKPHKIRRRSFVQGLGLVAGLGALSVGSAAADLPTLPNIDPLRPLQLPSPRLEPFRQTLAVPPIVTGSGIDLGAASSMHRFHPDLPYSPSLGYGGMDYLGPTIEAHIDQAVQVRYTNNIGAHPFAADVDPGLHGVSDLDRTQVPTSLHLHGGVTAPQYDGHPELIQRPGEGLTHEYTPGRVAGNHWYHDHAMGMTRLNVSAGLAGMYLLRDDADSGTSSNSLGLPSGEFEIPMILQDKIFTSDGHQSVRSIWTTPQGQWDPATPGDVGVVNGVVWPKIEVARGMYRLRLLNAASYSTFSLYFANRMRFWVIGTEGGLLASPAPTDRIRLSPGERADILVDFSLLEAGTAIELRNDEPVPLAVAQRGTVLMPVFCRFVVGNSTGFNGSVPQQMGLVEAPLGKPDVVRDLTIMQISRPADYPSMIMSLNNLRYTSDDLEMPRQGTTEQWNLINVTTEPHPIHLHLVTFQVLGRQSIDASALMAKYPVPDIGARWTPSADAFVTSPMRPPEVWETGAKDTVIVDANSITRVTMRFPTADELGFDPDATFPRGGMTDHSGHAGTGMDDLQGYVWHCHMLDHEDHDMMLRYRLVT
ncbi:copper oxidase [Rhodococcus sp. SRB_17]|uniref:multicopper oxidase family protein n=1 Tax=Rhodococcus sp. OK302 TaxID=1882769 RepID=UPI000B942F66|nr:multicopper oxidase domain-containing protein [Rhodococcus sp. OK302]NMM83665.1 copper oxidase [Rhodococcus sp. SRB_17]